MVVRQVVIVLLVVSATARAGREVTWSASLAIASLIDAVVEGSSIVVWFISGKTLPTAYLSTHVGLVG